MQKCIVYNRRRDGGVSICRPTNDIIAWMGCGGYWDAFPRGFMNVQVERQIESGISQDAARRYAHAVSFGGRTTAESLEIIRDRDCAPHGTAMELWDVDDVPRDRWFRDAWRRSHNGGPISIDLKLARSIQWKRARAAVAAENRRRAEQFDLVHPIEIDWGRLRERMRRASDEIELKYLWPRALLPAAQQRP